MMPGEIGSGVAIACASHSCAAAFITADATGHARAQTTVILSPPANCTVPRSWPASIVRIGLLAVATALFVERLLTRFPIDVHLDTGYASRGVLVVSVAVGLALFGRIVSRRS